MRDIFKAVTASASVVAAFALLFCPSSADASGSHCNNHGVCIDVQGQGGYVDKLTVTRSVNAKDDICASAATVYWINPKTDEQVWFGGEDQWKERKGCVKGKVAFTWTNFRKHNGELPDKAKVCTQYHDAQWEHPVQEVCIEIKRHG